jgi:hypothetical protein
MRVPIGHIAMRKSRFIVRPVVGGFVAFEVSLYNGCGYFDRAELLAMRAMGIHRYDERTGVLIGKGVDE